MPAPLPPIRARTRLTAAGRAALPAAGASLIASWAFGGVVGLFASTAVAALGLAFLLARLHVSGVRIAPPAPQRAHVGDAFSLALELANVGRTFAARHVVVTAGEGPGGRQASSPLAVLEPGERARVVVLHRLLRRGRHRGLAVCVASSFPLGLVERRLVFELPSDLLALPRLGSLNDLGRLPEARRRDASQHMRLQRGDDEFYGVRAWREGESLRRVHWRLSARRGRRIVREMRREEDPPVHLTLATLVPPDVPLDAPRRRFERAVSLAATLAEHFLRGGRTLRLTLAGDADETLEPARGRAGLLRVLTALAEVEMRAPERPVDLEHALQRAAARVRAARGEVHLAVYAGDGRRREADGLRAIDVEHPDAARLFLPGRHWGMGAPLGLPAVPRNAQRGGAW